MIKKKKRATWVSLLMRKALRLQNFSGENWEAFKLGDVLLLR